LILARILVGLSVVILQNQREKRNILVIPEEGVLLLADLDGVTAELNGATLAIRIHAAMLGN
jgi:hypothetical protein